MGDLEDFQGTGDKLERELDFIERHDESDQPFLRQFVTRSDGRIKESSIALYLQNARQVSKRADRPLSGFDRDYYDEFFWNLRNGSDSLSDRTVKNYQTALIRVLQESDADAEWTEDVTTVNPSKNTVSPSDMLQTEDIRALCEHANNLRDIALIEFLADTGVRITMAGTLRVGDLNLDDQRPTFKPNEEARGLKDAPIREYPLIDSRATLRTYRDRVHPRANRDDVAFFHAIPGHGRDFEDDDGAVTPGTLRRQLKEIADRADVEKPVNPHNFRHSAITRMRREGYDRAEVEKRVCWSVDSDMWQIYEHISGEQATDAVFERAGIAPEEDGPDAERDRCGNCFETLAPHHRRCPQCGAPADPELQSVVDEAESQGTDRMMAEQDDIQRMIQNTVLKTLRENDIEVDEGDVADVEAQD